ncbi:MAG: efflux RND transporter permease subunit [Actinomycetota bacterium]
MGLTRLVIQRPIVLLMVLAALMLLGWQSRGKMPAELDPRVEIPMVNVMTVYPGSGPEEIERTVTRPIEDAVSSVSNVTEVDSRSLEGVSFVSVDLKLGSDVNAAAADIRARIESIRRDLPTDIESPQVAKFDYNARPVMVLGVTADASLSELRTLVDEQIRPRLSQVPGLGSVTAVGGSTREVQIRVDPDRLAANGLSVLDLLRPLQAASRSAPAGSVAAGERDIAIRVLGEFGSLEDIRKTAIPPSNTLAMAMRRGRGPAVPSAPLQLGDLAEVTETAAEPEQITRVGRRESIGLILARLSDANTVEVAEGVKEAIQDLQRDLPSDVRISTLQDHSQAVADALEDINATLLLGAILAVLVVWVFLHSFRDTVIIALAIPTSIITTFIVMYFAGFSMNQMTMLALSLSVGILVDDSILVLESIHRHRAMGKSPYEAALDGREEIGLADAANTFVDIVVFIPIAFMGGIVGQFFREFGLTIATATLASLYISFTLTPMLAARWFRRGEPVHHDSRFARWFNRRYEALESEYRRTLAWSLRHRGAVALLGFGSLIGVGLLSWQVLGFDFTPSVDRGQVSVQIELPAGASLTATDAVMQEVEAVAEQIPGVEPDRMLASVGEIIGGFGSLPDRGPQLGQLTLMLQDKPGFMERLLRPGGVPGRRNRSDEDVATELRKKLAGLSAKARISVSAVRGLTSALAPIQIGLYGNNLEDLERVAAEVEARMSRIPTLQNLSSSLRRGKPELQVSFDRSRAEEQFATPAELAGALRTAVAGNTDLRFRKGDIVHPVRLMLSRDGERGIRATPSAVRDVVVAYRGASPVYVDDIASVRMGAGPTKILRSQRTRRVILSAHVLEGASLGAARSAVDAALADLPTGGIERKWEGDVDAMDESAGLMTGAILLAIALSYMLMAAVFNSLLHPLTIMVSVPMALVGGLLGLIYTGATMNIVSMIGIVMLIGLVSKNAILLVDYTNTLRQRGMNRNAAIESAGPVRLRPILMTTISTVLAMSPVALQIGRASEMRSPMAIVVIGGLLLSTLLTLLVVPVMYTYLDDATELILRMVGRGASARDAQLPEIPTKLAAKPAAREPFDCD